MATASVIVPCFNHAEFVSEAVDSVLRQSRPADEILVIDDCSTDGSAALLSAYADTGRVRLISNERNLGLVATLQRAVRNTSGEFICVLGSDDRLHPDFLTRTVPLLEADPGAGIVYTDLIAFGPRAEKFADGIPDVQRLEGDRFLWTVGEPTADRMATLAGGANFMHASSLQRRTAHLAAGGYRPIERWHEDQELFMRMISADFHPLYVREPLLEYRRHSPLQQTERLEARMAPLRRRHARRIRLRRFGLRSRLKAWLAR